LLFEYFIGLLIASLIIEVAVYATLYSTFGAMWIINGLFTITVEAVLLALAIVTYIKQRS
jgi:hypothetical protein